MIATERSAPRYTYQSTDRLASLKKHSINNVVDKSALAVDQDLDAVFTTVVGFADSYHTEKR